MLNTKKKSAVYIKKVLCAVAICAVLFSCFATPIKSVAFAANDISFDDTPIMEDLQNATINGKKFEISDYPKSYDRQPRLLFFAEYSFSQYERYKEDYGLYFYFYNPSGKIIEESELNKVEIATGYNANCIPVNYEKLSLKVISSSSDFVYYKLKIFDIRLKKILDVVSTTPSARRYDIVGIELKYSDNVNAIDFGIGGTWTFSGYAASMSDESISESTLSSVCSELNTVELDVNFTYYRTWQNTVGSFADQLTTAYFSVDKSIADDFDCLYRIKAETYKYLTSPIFNVYDRRILGTNSLLVNYSSLYDNLYSQRGIDCQHNGAWLGWDVFEDDQYSNYNHSFNTTEYELEKLAWLFQITKEEEFTVNTATLLNYMKSYSEEFGKDVLGKYSSDLFSDRYVSYVLGYREFSSGYKLYDITTDDEGLTLVGNNKKSTFWDRLLLGANYDIDEITMVPPIVEISYNTISGMSDEDISSTYYIAEREVPVIKEYLSKNFNKVTYLFRFDNSTYLNDYFVYEDKGNVGYYAQEPVFLDFDIISLGYKRDGVETTIPVISNPKDYLSTIELGHETFDDWWDELLNSLGEWFTKFFGILLIVLLIIVIIALAVFIEPIGKFFKFIFKIIVAVISAPFKFFAWLFGCGKSSKRCASTHPKYKNIRR